MNQSYYWSFTDIHKRPIDQRILLALIIQSMIFQILLQFIYFQRVNFSINDHRLYIYYEIVLAFTSLILNDNRLCFWRLFWWFIIVVRLLWSFAFRFLLVLLIIFLDNYLLLLLFLYFFTHCGWLFSHTRLFLYLFTRVIFIIVLILLFFDSIDALKLHSTLLLFSEVLCIWLYCLQQ